MIEKTVLDYLNKKLEQPVWPQVPEGEDMPDSYVLIEKTGSSRANRISTAIIAIQSYAARMIDAAMLNEAVKEAMDDIVELNEIGSSKLNSDYNFTDTETRTYRYQAVYNITHY